MTIFEKMLRKEIPANILFEDETVMAIHDIDPQAPKHILLIPKETAAGLNDIENWSDEQAGKYLKSALKAAKILGVEKSGYRLVINSGPHGGQTVPYLHTHILSGRRLGWPPG